MARSTTPYAEKCKHTTSKMLHPSFTNKIALCIRHQQTVSVLCNFSIVFFSSICNTGLWSGDGGKVGKVPETQVISAQHIPILIQILPVAECVINMENESRKTIPRLY